MLSDVVVELVIKGFFAFLLLLVGYAVVRMIRDAVHQYRMGAVYDLEQKEKAIHDANRKLTDAELVKQANDGLGLGSDNDPTKGTGSPL